MCDVGVLGDNRYVPCLVCDEVSGAIPTPGGLLHDDMYSVGFHAPPAPGNSTPFLGHLLVTPRRHVKSWSGLDDDEVASVSTGIRTLTLLLESAGAERVYVAVIGTHVDHLHVHLLPRWRGTPKEVPWHGVDEWEGSLHGDALTVEKTVARLRRGQQPSPDPA